MRILMLSQFYAPTVGGEETHVQTLSHALADRGHSVSVVTLWHEGLSRFEINNNVRVYRVPSTTRRAPWLFKEPHRQHVPPFPDPEIMYWLRRTIEKERPDIVHAHNWIIHSFVPLKRWTDAKLVLTLHDYSLICAQKRLMYHSSTPCSGPGPLKCLECCSDHYGPLKGIPTVLSNWAINVLERRAVDRFIAVSQAVADKNRLAHTGVPYEIIPNFVPKEVEDDLEGAEHYIKQLPGNDFLLFVGELSRDKGVHVALRAYEKLADALPLVLIGRRGTDFPDDVPANVIVLESWPHRYIGLAFRRSLFTLVPSIWFEPFGLVAIEAMAAGRPIVASRIGGLKDIVVDGVTGILVPAGDAESLLAAMGLLLNDSQLRDRMGIAARRRAVEFSLDAIIPAIERAYKSALESE